MDERSFMQRALDALEKRKPEEAQVWAILHQAQVLREVGYTVEGLGGNLGDIAFKLEGVMAKLDAIADR